MGINGPLYTWANYSASFVKKRDDQYRHYNSKYQVGGKYSLDFHKDLQPRYATIWDIFELKVGLSMLAGEMLHEAVNKWEQEFDRDISTLPSLHEDAFPTVLEESLLYDFNAAICSFKDCSDFSTRVQAAMEFEAATPGWSDKKTNAVSHEFGPKYPDPTDKPVEPNGKQLLIHSETGASTQSLRICRWRRSGLR